jgi:hypothetical protein
LEHIFDWSYQPINPAFERERFGVAVLSVCVEVPVQECGFGSRQRRPAVISADIQGPGPIADSKVDSAFRRWMPESGVGGGRPLSPELGVQ